jgi:2-keto-4-pentenoate hydratase/2-oxohepta-3-ene-1,7-dioic acid hydratase in catechol pathway
MILLTFRQKDALCLGVKTEGGVLDLAAAGGTLGGQGTPLTPAALTAAGRSGLPALQAFVDAALLHSDRAAWLLDEERLEYGPCLPQPGKIICIGLNYRKHARESNMEVPPVPVLFSKFQNALAAAGEPIPLPDACEKFDYEAELAVVMGKRGRCIPEAQALEHVLGYCNANDISERALQGKTSQWLLGKSLDKFLPIGPYLVTADAAGDPSNWTVRCWLNNDLRQDSNTADMIFSVPYLISFISQYMTLEPGDLICTGTPEGVILGRPRPRVWMKPGDVVTVAVGPLGRLTNPMAHDTCEELYV